MTDSVPCRRCIDCLGQAHHWMTIIATADPMGDIIVPCKHCDETTLGVDCEACGEIVPAASSHLCPEDSTWLCADCGHELRNEVPS